MNEIYGMIILISYLIFCISFTQLLYKKNYLNHNFSRKFLHILLSNIVLLLISFIDNIILAIGLPLCFIVINCIIHHYHLFQAIDKKEDHLGIVYYAIAIFLVVFLSYLTGHLQEGALSILILGYGDGLAGLVGTTLGKHPLFKKTWEGSLTLFISVFLLGILFSIPLSFCFSLATISMLVELFSKHGLDNLFLPLISFFLLLVVSTNSFMIYPLMIWCLNLNLALLIFSLKKLTLAGSIAAIILGFCTFYFLGASSFFALLSFLVVPNIIEKFRNRKKEKEKEEGQPRSIGQVIANGMIAFICSLGYAIIPHPYFIILFFVSIASANSDTLSGELGQLGKEKVKSILKRVEVEKGMSGGVTKLGFIGGILGAFMIALFAYVQIPKIEVFLFVIIFGFLGSIIDSILGELLEAKYYSQEENKIVERKIEGAIISGHSFITNNVVNFLSNFLVCLLASLIYLWIF